MTLLRTILAVIGAYTVLACIASAVWLKWAIRRERKEREL